MNIIIIIVTVIIGIISLLILGGSFPSFYLLAKYRIKQGDIKGIFIGRSYCEKCNTQLQWYNLVPIFSYFFQGGKCKKCGFKIPKKYFYYELISGLVFLVIGVGIGVYIIY